MCFMVYAAFAIKIESVEIVYKKAQNLIKAREQQEGRESRHTDEEEDLRDQAG